jgi:hypothetical protein
MQKLEEQNHHHFVNASNKQTVAKIMAIYSKIGVRRAGVVDFDVLCKPKEWTDALEEVGFTPDEINRLTGWREQIANFAKQHPADQRLQETRRIVDDVVKRIKSLETKPFADGEDSEKRDATETLLRTLKGRLHEAANVTKPWSEMKRKGRSALDETLQGTFDQLATLSAERGFFIVPTGALESILQEYGVKYTTNKREWIEQALTMIPGLQVDPKKQPWKLLSGVNTYLRRKAKSA